jgi:hypothetical protein
MTSVHRRTYHAAAIALILVSLAGCSHMPTMKWPWSAKPVPPPEKADELVVTVGESTTVANFPQYWKRNTLVLDLQGAASSGSVTLQPRVTTKWPVRLAFRVMPGQVGALEVRGDQRVVLPVVTEGSKPVDLELAPGVYTPKTAQVIVRWGPDSGYSPTG